MASGNGLSMLGGGQGARSAFDGVECAMAASREAEAARLLPAAAIGLIAGTAIAFAGYEWLTSDKQKHSV